MGETFAFSALAGGTSPFVYQWYFNNGAILAATNFTLLLTNLDTGDAGGYLVVVTNTSGSVTSSVANLSVVTTAPRAVWVKDVSQVDSNAAQVPLVLNANGRESVVRFSLRFNTNTFDAPTYEWGAGNSAEIISSNAVLGEIGFTVSRAVPGLFPAGQQLLGSIRFDLLGTNTAVFDGGLDFTNQPVPIEALDTNGLEMLLAAAVVPQLEVNRAQLRPTLNLNTGLFEQVVTNSNPSVITYNNLRVYVPFLGTDTSSNEMTLYDASGSANVDLDGDGSLENASFYTVPNLPPGAVQVVTNTFYVTDHATSPLVDYYVGIGGTPGVPMPATVAPLRITRAEFGDEGDFELEWPTRPGRSYSIRYANDLTDLSNPGSISISTNVVTGTGSPGQWKDEAPVEVKRFYQVIEPQ